MAIRLSELEVEEGDVVLIFKEEGDFSLYYKKQSDDDYIPENKRLAMALSLRLQDDDFLDELLNEFDQHVGETKH